MNEDYRLPTLPPGREVTPVPSNIPTLESQPDSTVILPDLDPEQMGIQINADRQPEEWVFALDRASQLGLRWVKVQVNWQRYQYEGPEQTWGPEFQQLEDFLRIAEDRGLMVMVSIAKAPRWARSTQVEDGPPDDPQHLANFISIFFSHRGGQTVDAVEIWNEPNLLREWQGQPLNGTSYMRYFDAGYQAVKAYSPSMPVVTAGLAPTGDNPGVSRNDRDYLQEMYDAGLGNYQDVFIGIHPYGWGNPPDSTCCPANSDRGWNDDPHFFFLDNINDMREIMVRNGHENRQMWITELGWATWEGLWGEPPQLWMDYNSVWDQAEYIIRSFEIAQQRPDIGLMFLWNLNYGSPELVESRSEQAAYTIMPENGGRLRPAFWMIYDAVRPDEVLDRYDRDG